MQPLIDWPPSLSLEAATSRLEDIAVHQQSSAAPRSAGTDAAAAGVAGAAVGAAAGAAAATSAADIALDDPPAVEAWDESIKPRVASFESLSETVGGNVAEQVSLLLESYRPDSASHLTYPSIVGKACRCCFRLGSRSSLVCCSQPEACWDSFCSFARVSQADRADPEGSWGCE